MCSAIDSTPFPIRLLVAALLGGGALLLIAARPPSPPPVYSVAAVRAGLIRSPGGWVGRTIRVRAVAGNPCVSWQGGAGTACISWRPALLDSYQPADPGFAPSAASALLLRSELQPPLLAALRRLPIARWLVGSPQQIRWGTLTTYRVLLQAAPTTVCSRAHCHEALLLDAAPGSP